MSRIFVLVLKRRLRSWDGGGGGEGGGGGVRTLSKISQDYPPPPHRLYTIYKQSMHTDAKYTDTKFSIALYSACIFAYALWSLEITMDSNIYHIP